jgi:spermidine/putrescine-binding protein
LVGDDPDSDPSLAKVWPKLAQLKPNIGAIVNAEALAKVLASKKIDMFVALVGNALTAKDLGVNAKWHVPKEGAYLGRDAVFVLKNLPPEVTYYGQVFANHCMGAAHQSLQAKVLGVVPTNPKATLPAYMRGDPAFPFTADQVKKYAISIPEDVQAKGQTQWQAKYDQALK